MRVLVVEDEELLAGAVAEGLRRDGMAVDVVGDGVGATDLLALHRYDVVVLDRDLPGLSGDDVCRAIGEGAVGELGAGSRHVPRVLMLTASGTVDDRVEGLRIGADDYLPKPFAFVELVARVRALGRRSSPARPPVLRHGDLVVDSFRRIANRADRPLELSRKELAVLEVLVEAAGAPVTAEELLERGWDEHADPFTNTVRQTMVGLRRKLGEPAVIETVVGVGYRLCG
jgi:DNA-binding response OmpR family regulator